MGTKCEEEYVSPGDDSVALQSSGSGAAPTERVPA